MLTRYARLALLHGVDDWFSARELGALAYDEGVQMPELQRDFAVLIARELVGEGLAEVGFLEDGEFRAWEGSQQEVLERFSERVLNDSSDGWGVEVWLSNTESGNDAGAQARVTLAPEMWSW